MRTMIARASAITLATTAMLVISPAPAAADPSGIWLRENGGARVRMAKCGDAICGTITWLKDPANTKSKVGQRVFFDMKPNGADAWAGKAFNPEDGQTYSGKITLSGSSMTTAGCVAGGWICRSVSWSRVN
ncbi:MAG: DUF2147 domain-containing protein [Hyphomicrobiales bacterium]|jgi:uncharacterized protein (DUF2147 family)|nr:DUF2147 domain-containing protein [Hyphomicrobiales bacterium]